MTRRFTCASRTTRSASPPGVKSRQRRWTARVARRFCEREGSARGRGRYVACACPGLRPGLAAPTGGAEDSEDRGRRPQRGQPVLLCITLPAGAGDTVRLPIPIRVHASMAQPGRAGALNPAGCSCRYYLGRELPRERILGVREDARLREQVSICCSVLPSDSWHARSQAFPGYSILPARHLLALCVSGTQDFGNFQVWHPPPPPSPPPNAPDSQSPSHLLHAPSWCTMLSAEVRPHGWAHAG